MQFLKSVSQTKRNCKFGLTSFCFIAALFLFVTISVSCSSRIEGIDAVGLGRYVNKITDCKNVFVIPATGCGGCIDEAIGFAKKNIGNPNYYFIITRIHDAKIVKNWLGRDASEIKNIYFDKQNEIGKFGYFQVFPFRITWNNRKIGDIVFMEAADFENVKN